MGLSERLLSLLQADAPEEVGKPAPVALAPPNMSKPPEWAQSLIKALASPVSDAGAYLGGVMGGQVPFHPAEAMQEAVKFGSALAGPKLGASTLAAMAAPAAKAGMRLAPEAEQAAAQGIRAYHGSPHDFNQFDLSKIGTGEGAQAYGHGLYFAGNEKVAESYRPPPHWPENGDVKKGHMYEVNINANPDHFLDWDKPLSAQSTKAQETAKRLGITQAELTSDPINLADSGAGVYSAMIKRLGSEDAASRALHEAGIPGIKYLDQGSRGAGTGTSNYVAFDPKMIEILKKYGLAGAIAGPAAASAGLETQTPQQ